MSKRIEKLFRSEHVVRLSIELEELCLSEAEIRQHIANAGMSVGRSGIVLCGARRTLEFDLIELRRPSATEIPDFVVKLTHVQGVLRLRWHRFHSGRPTKGSPCSLNLAIPRRSKRARSSVIDHCLGYRSSECATKMAGHIQRLFRIVNYLALLHFTGLRFWHPRQMFIVEPDLDCGLYDLEIW